MTADSQPRSDPNVLDFVAAARKYCSQLTASESQHKKWYFNLLQSLSALYASAHCLPIIEDVSSFEEVSLDRYSVGYNEWAEMFSSLKARFGDDELYWLAFHRRSLDEKSARPCDEQFLVDDLADVYRDMKSGLKAWDSDDRNLGQAVVWEWREGRFDHWTSHAIGAMTALHHLVYEDGSWRFLLALEN